jgi:hypothetical protein
MMMTNARAGYSRRSCCRGCGRYAATGSPIRHTTGRGHNGHHNGRRQASLRADVSTHCHAGNAAAWRCHVSTAQQRASRACAAPHPQGAACCSCPWGWGPTSISTCSGYSNFLCVLCGGTAAGQGQPVEFMSQPYQSTALVHLSGLRVMLADQHS